MKQKWFENEKFWSAMYPFMFPKERFEKSAEEVAQISALAKRSGTAVLDLCCGPGRHAVEFAKNGWKVTGVDKSRFLLNKAKKRAKSLGVNVEFVRKDMRNFRRKNSFDLAVNMFTAFGYFDKKSDDVKVLHNIFQSLRKNGVLVIDVMGKERLARILQPTTASPQPDGSLLVQRHEIFDEWTRIRNEWILIKNGRARSFRFHHTVYSGQELKDRLLKTGFCRIKLYGNLDGHEYGPGSQRLVAVAWKA